MAHLTCRNPACQKSYEVDDIKKDDGFCSDECWEKVNCLEPVYVHFEEICLGA